MNATLYSHVANSGLTADKWVLDHTLVAPEELTLTIMAGFPIRSEVQIPVKETYMEDNMLHIIPEGFSPAGGYTLTGTGAASDIKLSSTDTEQAIADMDKFEAKQENDVNYRLYAPKAAGPRPLILFLHGGGECGTDNLAQMTGTLGALHLAKLYPDMYVMAPQAPRGMIQAGVPMPNMNKMTFATSDMPGLEGWSRPLLGRICDIIRSMIAQGQVNPSRVYVTGMSMGGGGTLRALSVGSDLFAAGAPICPTMTPETFKILCGLTHTKIWISTAYIDHTLYRHKYIVDGIMALKDAGNKNAHLTLYSPEELEAYGLATDPDMPLPAKFGANHASWILTLNNEYGIMSWLTEQIKE